VGFLLEGINTMKYIILAICIVLLLATGSFADESIKDICEKNVCLAAFDFGFGFGFGGSGGAGDGPAGDGFLLETGDFLLMETDDYLLLE
jgi:hypothetical protein